MILLDILILWKKDLFGNWNFLWSEQILFDWYFLELLNFINIAENLKLNFFFLFFLKCWWLFYDSKKSLNSSLKLNPQNILKIHHHLSTHCIYLSIMLRLMSPFDYFSIHSIITFFVSIQHQKTLPLFIMFMN